MNHYRHLIQVFGAPNGLCSSITESKHVKAVKEPWRRSNHFNALGQMLLTNQRLDKLAAARVDFENRGMLQGSVLSAAIDEIEAHGEQGHDQDAEGEQGHGSLSSQPPKENVSDSESVIDDEETHAQDDEHVLNYVRLAKTRGIFIIIQMVLTQLIPTYTTVRGYPTNLDGLSHHIQQPTLLLLTRQFLCSQLQNGFDPIDDGVVPDLSDCSVSVFHSAVATFYAPSDLSGLGGMHSETIRSTPSWRKGPARYDTVFLEKDPEIPGMAGLHLGRVFLFFSFIYDSIKYLCALIQWYTTISDGPDEDTGMWIVQPDFDANCKHELTVVHLHSILRAVHLIPVYGQERLPSDLHYSDTLNNFRAYYVNKYIDHHAFEIAF